MKIKVLGIAGSPRHGNSEYLLQAALESAQGVYPDLVETGFYSMVGKKFAGCISCFKCFETKGECIQQDSFQELKAKWDEADVIIYSFPVYHMGVPGQMRCFMDRLGNTNACRYLPSLPKLNKVIGTITQGTHLFSGQENVIMQVINHTLMMGCIPVTGDMPECYIGAASWTAHDIDKNALKNRVDGEQMDALMGMKGASGIAKRAVELALMVKSGAGANRDRFQHDDVYAPLFERVDSIK